MAEQPRYHTSKTRFLELPPHHDASGIGVMVIPGAGWEASVLHQPAALLTEAGHAVVLCDPRGTVTNPGPFCFDDLWYDCATQIAGWDVHRIVLLTHSMGARTAARLAALDARIVQIWVAPVSDSRRCLATLYARGQADELHHMFFGPPFSAAERAALEALQELVTEAWQYPARCHTLQRHLDIPSRGGVRVPHMGDFLREVVYPGYVLAPRDGIRLWGVLVPPDDAWIPLEVTKAFCAEVGVPVTVLTHARGHGARGGWSEILEHVRSFLMD